MKQNEIQKKNRHTQTTTTARNKRNIKHEASNENDRNEKEICARKETERNKSELFQITHKAHRYRIAPWKIKTSELYCGRIALDTHARRYVNSDSKW